MLRLDHLRLQQGTFTLEADLTVPAGAIVAVIGPSGGGKSTLLTAIAGFVAPVSGRILWAGSDITGAAPGDRPVSILFQDGNLFPHLTIEENVGLALGPRLRHGPAARERIRTALEQVGLGGMGARRPAALSGGQQSRAALARVLLADRPLVLLDEPFSALGPGLRQDMLDLAARTLGGAGRTVLVVTHDPDDARRVAETTIFVADGHAAAPRPTGALLDNPPPALAAYLGDRAGQRPAG